MLKVGDFVHLRKNARIPFPYAKIKIIEIKDGLYRVGKSVSFGSIWLSEDYFV